ncbi:plancitoxin-1-like [Brevipalpus obovatus]|uniref:plancitoxin-1-like n=1 Tax=Brevipalpus obovatus TaxID=246614 RepID=UPI003D9DC6CD
MIFLWGILILSIFIKPTLSSDISCKDEEGKPVDWWVAYKMPSSVAESESGTKYVFKTSNDEKSSSFKLSSKDMKKEDNIFYETVEPIYKDSSSASYLFYNDQYGGESAGSKGHCKGVVAFDKKTGFWIIHSIPEFMPGPGSKGSKAAYEFPDSGRANGQTGLCLTFDAQDFPTISKQLTIARPNIYDSGNIEDEGIQGILNNQYPSPVELSKEVIKTKGGLEMTHFAKSPTKESDIYEKIADDLNVDLEAQSWKKGSGGFQNSECGDDNSVKNIQSLAAPLGEGGKKSDEWEYLKDHSKWAVADSDKDPEICIGDINRMDSQLKRGGGMMCFKNRDVWNAFRDTIKEVEPCKKGEGGSKGGGGKGGGKGGKGGGKKGKKSKGGNHGGSKKGKKQRIDDDNDVE